MEGSHNTIKVTENSTRSMYSINTCKEYQTFYSTVHEDKRKYLIILNMTKCYNYRLAQLNRKTNVKPLTVTY
jgi:hypothetical protein